MNIYLDMFCTFFRIGLFTFGGGYAMLPMLQREVVEKKHWATEEELLDYYAIGQCTPGIIAVNTATFVGCRHKNTLGGVAATLGVVAPSLLIITAIAALLTNFADLALVKNAFAGIRVCVCVLILNSVVKLLRSSAKDIPCKLVFAVVFLGSVLWNGSEPVVFVLAAGLFGVVWKVVLSEGKKEAEQ